MIRYVARWLLVGLLWPSLWPLPSLAQEALWETHTDVAIQAYKSGDLDRAKKQLKAAAKAMAEFPSDDPRRTISEYLWTMVVLAKPGVRENLITGSLAENISRAYLQLGRLPEAVSFMEQAVASWEEELGPQHKLVRRNLQSLGLLYKRQGRYAEAERFYLRALANTEKALGPEHTEVAQSLNNLAVLYHDQGRYAEAEPLYQQSLAIWEKAVGEQHPDLVTTLENYTTLLRGTGRDDRAVKMEARAKAIRAKHPQANPVQ